MSQQLTFQTLTPSRWKDLERLFGERGACGGCWCMWWRLKRSEYELQKGEGNRKTMRRIVLSGEVPGLLAYDGGRPVGPEVAIAAAASGSANVPNTSRKYSLSVSMSPLLTPTCCA